MKFNINDTVRVRLTDHGRAVLRQDWESTTNIYYGRPEQRAIRGEYKPPKEDENGWSEWQLWALMNAFGEHTWLASQLCLETTIEIPNAADELDRLRAENTALKAERDEAQLKLHRIRCEIDCRIEHGADSNGHLEAILAMLKKEVQP